MSKMICKTSNCQIKSHGCYGGYCNKHKKIFLLKDNSIDTTVFTNNIKDYSLKELKDCYKEYIYEKKDKPSKFKKLDFFNKVSCYCVSQEKFSQNISKIIQIQSCFRGYHTRLTLKFRGIASIKRDLCNNEEDFYSYEPLQEIPMVYFYSYKDDNHYWGFDIRSLVKLIEMKYGNPYTTEPFPPRVITRLECLLNKLKYHNVSLGIVDTQKTDRKTMIKQKVVDLFSQIECSGYSCDIQWFLNLNNFKLKRMYRELEDIWNYRAQLPNQVKRSIIQPDGRLFTMPVSDYCNIQNKLELQEILINSLSKILNARSQDDMKLGFMYILISLSIVSRPCYVIHRDWVQYVF